MILCEEIKVRVSAFIDGELSEQQQNELMEHLAACPACRAYLAEQTAIHESFAQMEAEAPAGFADSVMEKVRNTRQDPVEKKVIAFPLWRRWGALAACLALVLVGVWTMGGRSAVENGVPQMARTAPESALSVAEITVDDSAAVAYSVAEDMSAVATDNSAATSAAGAACQPALRVQDEEKSLAHTDAIITASDVAKAWVEEQLQEQWIPGCGYELTKEQFAALREALDRAGEPYSLEDGEEEAVWYLVAAE